MINLLFHLKIVNCPVKPRHKSLPAMQSRMKICFFLIIELIFSIVLHAQQGNVWAFGYHSGLDFNFRSPKPIKTIIHYPNYCNPVGSSCPAISSSSISDCRGNLLFYGTNAEIYNRFNTLMPNGHLNSGDGGGVVYIVPMPGDTNKYYYFHEMGGTGIGAISGLYYSIVDMTLDSGRGDVITSSIETKINSSPCGFTIVKNSNNKDYWIVSIIKTNSVPVPTYSDSIYVYPLTASGIGKPKKQPKISSQIVPYWTQIRGDHKGDRIIITEAYSSATNTDAIQYNFNNSFGVLSKPRLFFDRIPSYNTNINIFLVSAEYSPNDSFLYITEFEPNPGISNFEARLYQCGTYTGLTPLKLHTLLYRQTSGLQLGPDNAIYWGVALDSFLHKIQNPDNAGSSCNIIINAVDIRPGKLGIYLPNIYAPVRNLKFKGIDNAAASCADSIHFTNLSDTVYFKFFKWYFGDGDSSTKYAPWHAYKKQGKYNVLLVGINDCGAKLYYSDSVTVHLPAHAGFKIDTTTYTCLKAKLTVHNTFKDTTQIFSFNFGDSTGWMAGDTTVRDAMHHVSANHTYLKTGSYTIAQAVNDGFCQDTQRQSITIAIEPMPKAGFTIASPGQCKPYSLQVKNTSQNADSYLWSTPVAPSGMIQDTAFYPLSLSISLSALDTGYHLLTLIAYNRQGCVDTLKEPKAIYISPHPVPSFTSAQTIECGSVKVVFNNTSNNGNPNLTPKYSGLRGFLWNFDDLSSDTATAPTHRFTSQQTYHVAVVAFNNFCQDTFKQDVNITIPLLRTAFSTIYPKGCPGLKTSFNNQTTFGNKLYNVSGQLITFQWDFGDGSTDTAASPIHSFSNPGSYSVRLITASPQGCRDTLVRKNYITVLPYPKAALAVRDSIVLCQAFRYNFNNQSTYADSFTWNFGDGSSLVILNDTSHTTHTYKSSGDFKVILQAGNGFCLDSSLLYTAFTLRPKPVPDFTADTATVCLGKAIAFKNNSTQADSLLWFFGDGTKDTAANPVHRYLKPGKYNISLVAKSKEGCAVTLQKTSFVQVADTFSAQISPKHTIGCAPLNVQFISSTMARDLPLDYIWDFGDGTMSTLQNPLHQYQQNGIKKYAVKLIVSNKYCLDSASAVVSVKNLNPLYDTIIMRLATVENDAYARIWWQKNPLAARYTLLRSEDGTSYMPVAETTDTEYFDHAVNVHRQAYRYKVLALDACGGTSALSKEATTIFLSGKTAAEDAICNLVWNNYQVFHYGLRGYELYKDNALLSPVINNKYIDPDFFSEIMPAHEYQVIAYENQLGNDTIKSRSNILHVPLQPRLWIPNAFTPANHDAYNDSFYVRATGISGYHITIYNRWGERVFESNDIRQRWFDNSGTAIQEGVYLYMIQAKSAAGELIYRKGTITVLK
jgi:PKD repeat protein